MEDLAKQRCHMHAHREAAARCPECGGFFCRECITEHEGRVLCSSCLRKVGSGSRALLATGAVYNLLSFSSGFLLLCLCFYHLGRTLLALPDAFHAGTLWESPWWLEP